MEIIGRQLELGVALETTRGTAETTAERWIKNVTATIQERAEHAIDDNSHGNLADSDNRRVIKKWVEGSLEGILQVDVVGYFLYNIFGGISSSLVETGVYSHAISLDSTTIEHPSLTFFAKDGGVQNLNISNGMISSLEINASMDDYVRFTTNIMASEASTGTDTPAYSEEQDFVGKDITVKTASTEGGLAAATAISIKELGITLDTGAIVDYVLGQYNPDDIYDGKLSIQGTIVKNFTDEVYKDLFLGDDAKYMEIAITGSQVIGATENPTITILLNKVKITAWERSGGNDELVTEALEFKAFYNETDDEMGKITIINNTDEYDNPASS